MFSCKFFLYTLQSAIFIIYSGTLYWVFFSSYIYGTLYRVLFSSYIWNIFILYLLWWQLWNISLLHPTMYDISASLFDVTIYQPTGLTVLKSCGTVENLYKKMHIYISRNKYTFYMKLSNFLVIFISSSWTCLAIFILLFQKDWKVERKHIFFGTERPGKKRELCLIFADEF